MGGTSGVALGSVLPIRASGNLVLSLGHESKKAREEAAVVFNAQRRCWRSAATPRVTRFWVGGRDAWVPTWSSAPRPSQPSDSDGGGRAEGPGSGKRSSSRRSALRTLKGPLTVPCSSTWAQVCRSMWVGVPISASECDGVWQGLTGRGTGKIKALGQLLHSESYLEVCLSCAQSRF